MGEGGYSAPKTPSWFKGALLLREKEGKGRNGVGEEIRGEGRKKE